MFRHTRPFPLLPAACRVALAVCTIGTVLPLTPAAVAAPAATEGQLTIRKVKATGWEGEPYEAERGILMVRSVRSDPSSPLIGLGFHLFRSKSPEARSRPPVYIMSGGPAWSVIPGLSFSKEVAPFLAFADVVIPDQRGFTYSDPYVTCAIPSGAEWRLQVPPDRATDIAQTEKACKAEVVGRGINPEAYVISELADDVNDLRKALGQEKIVLTGGSFGSQWSFAIMHRHPGIVARAMLSGIEGPDHGYDAPWGVLEAVRKIAADADASPRLSGRVPEGGHMAAVERVLARLDSKPALVPAKHPVTGKPIAVRITSADVKANLVSWGDYGLSDMEGITRWPALVSALDAGDYRPILKSVIGNRLGLNTDPEVSGNIEQAIYMPIDCSYGITDDRRTRILAAPEQRILGDINARYFNGCHIWSVRDAGKDIRDNFRTDIPVLMIQGEVDTSTPLENAQLMQKLMPNSRLMVVQRGTHNVEWEVMEAHPQLWGRVMTFIQDGTMPDLPAYLEMPEAAYVRP